MKVDLLIEIGILFGAFVPLREARVVKPRVVGVPFNISTRGRVLRARNDIVESLPRFDIENRAGSVFASSFREGNGNQFAIVGRDIPIDGSCPVRIQLIRVDDDFSEDASVIDGRTTRNGWFFGGCRLMAKSFPVSERVIGGGSIGKKFLDSLVQRFPGREFVKD